MKAKWNIRKIVWNRGSGPNIWLRFIQIDEEYTGYVGEKHPRLPRRSANYGSVWKFGPEMSNPHPAISYQITTQMYSRYHARERCCS